MILSALSLLSTVSCTYRIKQTQTGTNRRLIYYLVNINRQQIDADRDKGPKWEDRIILLGIAFHCIYCYV